MAVSDIGPGVRLVALQGDLDLADAQKILDEFKQLDDISIAVVDLSALTYMDSTVLGLLVKLHQRRFRQGRKLLVVRPGPNLARILSVTGLDKILRLCDSVQDAKRQAKLP